MTSSSSKKNFDRGATLLDKGLVDAKAKNI